MAAAREERYRYSLLGLRLAEEQRVPLLCALNGQLGFVENFFQMAIKTAQSKSPMLRLDLSLYHDLAVCLLPSASSIFNVRKSSQEGP